MGQVIDLAEARRDRNHMELHQAALDAVEVLKRSPSPEQRLKGLEHHMQGHPQAYNMVLTLWEHEVNRARMELSGLLVRARREGLSLTELQLRGEGVDFTKGAWAAAYAERKTEILMHELKHKPSETVQDLLRQGHQAVKELLGWK